MPFILIGGAVIAGVAAIVGADTFGTSLGQEAGNGLSDALVIVGIASGVGIILYAQAKTK